MNRSCVLSLVRILALSCLFPLLLGGCGSHPFLLQHSVQSDAYRVGFQDGRYSGFYKAGNSSAMLIKDTQRFRQDEEYRQGWLEGEQEGIRIQRESGQSAVTASSDAAAGGDTKTVTPDIDRPKPALPALDASRLKF